MFDFNTHTMQHIRSSRHLNFTILFVLNGKIKWGRRNAEILAVNFWFFHWKPSGKFKFWPVYIVRVLLGAFHIWWFPSSEEKLLSRIWNRTRYRHYTEKFKLFQKKSKQISKLLKKLWKSCFNLSNFHEIHSISTFSTKLSPHSSELAADELFSVRFTSHFAIETHTAKKHIETQHKKHFIELIVLYENNFCSVECSPRLR